MASTKTTLPTRTIAEADEQPAGTVSKVRGGYRVSGVDRTYTTERGAKIAGTRIGSDELERRRTGHITPQPHPGEETRGMTPAELAEHVGLTPDTPPRRAGGGRPSTGSGRTPTPGSLQGEPVS